MSRLGYAVEVCACAPHVDVGGAAMELLSSELTVAGAVLDASYGPYCALVYYDPLPVALAAEEIAAKERTLVLENNAKEAVEADKIKLNDLFKRIKEKVKPEGLKWSENCKLVEVAFGVKKMLLTAVLLTRRAALVSAHTCRSRLLGAELRRAPEAAAGHV